MAHVVMRAGKNLIESVITKRSADEMKLKVGDKVSAVIKSTEVMLERLRRSSIPRVEKRPNSPSQLRAYINSAPRSL